MGKAFCCLIAIVLFLLCLAPMNVMAADESMVRAIDALNKNAAALQEATQTLEKAVQTLSRTEQRLCEIIATGNINVSGNAAAASSAPPPELIAENSTVPQNIKALMASLKWDTNTEGSSMGSPEAVKGGTLKYSVANYPANLRFLGKNGNSTFQRMLELLCYETLVGMDSVTLKYQNSLADRWAIADDKLTFFFHIDPRARWSDGKPVVSEDIVASWELRTDESIEDPFANDFWKKFEKPVALSKSLVMVKAKQLSWSSFYYFACSMTILPAHYLKGISGAQWLTDYQNKMMVGSGPYTYESSKTNEEIILKRREDWWQDGFESSIGVYNFDRLQFIFIEDENLLKEKFKKGDLDWFQVMVAREWHQEFIPAKTDQIAKGWIQKIKVYTHKPLAASGMAFNMRIPPFNDKKVRMAVAHLYNREKMMDKLFFNEYEFVDSYWPNSFYSSTDNPKIRFDPDTAVKLLEEAGWLQSSRDENGWLNKDGVRFELDLNYVSKSSERILTIFQEDLRDVGIKLNLKQVTWATDIKEVGERNFQISQRAYAGILFPNPESSLHSKFADQKHNNNIWGFKNKRVDELCEGYHLMFDPQERIKAIREIDGIVMNEYLYAYGWYASHTRLLYWNKFGMPPFVLGKSSPGDERSIPIYWWYDAKLDARLRDAVSRDESLPIREEIVKWWDENYPNDKIGELN